MKVKAWVSHLKHWLLKVLDLMATTSIPAQKDGDNNWWRYYEGF